jgi:hypothetical protein
VVFNCQSLANDCNLDATAFLQAARVQSLILLPEPTDTNATEDHSMVLAPTRPRRKCTHNTICLQWFTTIANFRQGVI